MRCPSCDKAIDEHTAWKSAADRFYCSEFCADLRLSRRCRRRAGPSESISTGNTCSGWSGLWRCESNTPLKTIQAGWSHTDRPTSPLRHSIFGGLGSKRPLRSCGRRA